MHFAKRRGLVYLCTWLKYIFDRQINKGIFFKEKNPQSEKNLQFNTNTFFVLFVCLFLWVFIFKLCVYNKGNNYHTFW